MSEEKKKDYWIKPGIPVKQKFLNNSPIMIVQKMNYQNNNGRNFIKGVVCYWFDANQQLQTNEFKTTDLEKTEL